MVGRSGIRKIGDYSYPLTIMPAKALEIAKKILDTKHDKFISTVGLAKTARYGIDEKTGSVYGGFRKALEALHLSGVFEQEKRGTQKVTELAVKALDPHDPEGAKRARAKIYVSQIPLLVKVHEKCEGKIPPEDEFSALLKEITDVSWPEAKKHTKNVRKLYLEAKEYLPHAEKPELALKPEKAISRGETRMPTDRAIWDTVMDAARMRWGPKKESREAFERILGRANELNLERTRLVVETLRDLIGDNGHVEIRKGSGRVLEALEKDLNVQEIKPREKKEVKELE